MLSSENKNNVIPAAVLLSALPLFWLTLLTFITQYDFNPDTYKDVSKIYKLSFLETEWCYLILNFSAFVFPFLLSFDKKVHFYKKWKYLFPGMLLVGIFFLVWDIWFTKIGVWGFNPKYINFIFLGLPLGEWLFFLVVPYCCVFVHECLLCYFSSDPLKKYDKIIGGVLIGIFFSTGLANLFKSYTAWAFLFSAFFMVFHQFYIQNTYRTRFYIAYLICLIPFTLINGALTGSFTDEPVVIYNDVHNLSSVLGCRFISIPFDDFAYGFLMIFANITIYEALKSHSAKANF
jgi:lycopene cyclase domain-containing protein